MRTMVRNLWLIPAALLFSGSAAAQTAAPEPLPPAPSDQLLAGLREYPPEFVTALLQLADQPEAVRNLARDPALFEKPESVKPELNAEQRAAVRRLAGIPEIVFIAAPRADELANLRSMPEQRVSELRNTYADARAESERAWQDLLENEPDALMAYATLVSNFVREQQGEYKDFPYVRISNPAYFMAAPPDETLMAYADQSGDEKVKALLAAWWEQFSPERMDERIANNGARPGVGRPALAAAPRTEREAMWSAASGDPGNGYLMPVIMQPAADQPADARIAFAVSEHARLWLPQPSPAELAEAERRAAAQDQRDTQDVPVAGSDITTSAPPLTSEPSLDPDREVIEHAREAEESAGGVEWPSDDVVVEEDPAVIEEEREVVITEQPIPYDDADDVVVIEREPVYVDVYDEPYYRYYSSYPFFTSYLYDPYPDFYCPPVVLSRLSYLHCYPYVYPAPYYTHPGLVFSASFHFGGRDRFYHGHRHHWRDRHDWDGRHHRGDRRGFGSRLPGRYFGPGRSFAGIGDRRRFDGDRGRFDGDRGRFDGDRDRGIGRTRSGDGRFGRGDGDRFGRDGDRDRRTNDAIDRSRTSRGSDPRSRDQTGSRTRALPESQRRTTADRDGGQARTRQPDSPSRNVLRPGDSRRTETSRDALTPRSSTPSTARDGRTPRSRSLSPTPPRSVAPDSPARTRRSDGGDAPRTSTPRRSTERAPAARSTAPNTRSESPRASAPGSSRFSVSPRSSAPRSSPPRSSVSPRPSRSSVSPRPSRSSVSPRSSAPRSSAPRSSVSPRSSSPSRSSVSPRSSRSSVSPRSSDSAPRSRVSAPRSSGPSRSSMRSSAPSRGGGRSSAAPSRGSRSSSMNRGRPR